MSADPRVKRNSRSVTALQNYLKEIINDPTAFADDVKIFKDLKSQGALSKVTIEDRLIYGSSINTQKRIAANVLDGGFESLDRLRIAALDAICNVKLKSKKSKKTTKVGLGQRVKELEHELQQALQDIWHLTMVASKAMAQGRHYAKEAANPVILTRCEREQRELRAALSLRSHPVIVRGVEGCGYEGK